MKIKLYFRGKDIPNTVYNRYGQGFVDVKDCAPTHGGFLQIIDLDGDIVAINSDIITAVDISPAK